MFNMSIMEFIKALESNKGNKYKLVVIKNEFGLPEAEVVVGTEGASKEDLLDRLWQVLDEKLYSNVDLVLDEKGEKADLIFN